VSQVGALLRIASINVCALRAKLRFQEFHDFIKGFDIICLQETKLDSYDDVVIDGFQMFQCNRKGNVLDLVVLQ
jgi:exonuclease III